MMKKMLSLLSALALCLGLWAFPASAAGGDFTIEDGVLTKYNGPGGDVVIPEGITTIGGFAFSGCTGLTSVTIPDSVTSIRVSAFLNCTGLTSVTIPNSVTSIGLEPFLYCTGLTDIQVDSGNNTYTSVTGVLFSKDGKTLHTYPGGRQGAYTIPSSVTNIARGAFRGCTGLTSVTIPNSVTSIGSHAFMGCENLASMTIPDSVTSIEGAAFSDCMSLTDIQVDSGNNAYTSVTGVLYSKDGKTLHTYPGGRQGTYTIPSSVTNIAAAAFAGCTDLTSVTIPSSVTSIEGSAFYRTGLTSVTIPSSVTTIGGSAFSGCTGLTSVTIPSSVTSIERLVFNLCESLTDVYYGGSKAEWEAIQGDFRSDLTNVKIHYATDDQQGPPAVTVKDNPAMPTNDSLTADGVLQTPTVYKINGSNYFKIRDLAAILNGTEKQFSVGYDAELKSVTATTGEGYEKQEGDLAGAPAGGEKTAEPSNDAIYINGEKVEAEVYKIDGSNYFKLRDLGKALDFYVGYSAETGVFLETGKPYSE